MGGREGCCSIFDKGCRGWTEADVVSGEERRCRCAGGLGCGCGGADAPEVDIVGFMLGVRRWGSALVTLVTSTRRVSSTSYLVQRFD